MKNYTITVNGTVYDVTVEDKGGSGVSPVAPVAAPKAAAAPVSSGAAGSVKIEAGAAGKVVKIAAAAGASVHYRILRVQPVSFDPDRPDH